MNVTVSPRRRRLPLVCLVSSLLAVVPFTLHAQEPTAAAAPTGAIAGRVLDRATGRPIPQARVFVAERPGGAEADLDGRYRLGGLTTGTYTVRATFIGYRPVQVDSLVVKTSQVTTANFALESAPLELEELVVQTQLPASKASDAGLLAIQQAAPAASDGISAEAMAKTPDSDASAAITRVTGVTVVDDKFVVIRGLGERYTNTLLNGTELASPEPLKRVVPLDVFPANLLESIVTSKAATPDKPGDFAGGSVEIKTKEFPEQFTAQLNLSQQWNSQATFRDVMRGPRSFGDFFAFGGAERDMPAVRPTAEDNAAPVKGTEQALRAEIFGESIRNVWTPDPVPASPNLGFSFNVGGQLGAESTHPVGVVLATNYSNTVTAVRDRIFRLAGGSGLTTNAIDNRTQEGQTTVEWGGIANISTRLGTSNKLALKNFYSRGAEETFLDGRTFIQEFGGDGHLYQARYIERSTFQTQLTGEHRLGFLRDVRLEWKGTFSRAKRDEPENRALIYGVSPDGQELAPISGGTLNQLQFRFLTDKTYVGQTDLSLPFTFRGPLDAVLKVGALVRSRGRDFDGTVVRTTNFADVPSDNFALTLAPEQFWSPEVIGELLTFKNGGVAANSYESDDDVGAVYGMVDFPLFPSIRVVGGMRMETWNLDVFTPSRAIVEAGSGDSLVRRNRDYLFSANLTAALSDRVNLRLAAFTTVVRPDPRELTEEQYFPVGGECSLTGDSRIQRTKVVNGDLKWEFFPRPGEIVSLSGYYKDFTTPIINNVGSTSNGCEIAFANATSAQVYGAEVELRKRLDFVSPGLADLSLGLNLAVTESRVVLDSAFNFAVAREIEPALQAQSPYIINASLSYDRPDGGFSATLLYNRFGDRIAQYGASSVSGNNEVNLVADRIERGRGTLDAKLTRRFGGALSLSLSGRNLTNAIHVVTQDTPNLGVIRVSEYRPGVTVSLGAGYDF